MEFLFLLEELERKKELVGPTRSGLVSQAVPPQWTMIWKGYGLWASSTPFRPTSKG